MKFLILPTMQHIALKDIVFLANYFAGLRGRWGFWITRKIRMLLKSIFEEAGNDDLINKNPMRRLPLPSTADPDKPGLREWQAQARGPCRRHAGREHAFTERRKECGATAQTHALVAAATG